VVDYCSGFRFKAVMCCLLFVGMSVPAYADPAQAATVSNSVIQGAFENVSGLTRVNATAGSGNVQQNSGAIAIVNDQRLDANAKVSSSQLTHNVPDSSAQSLSAKIGPGAFDGARGMTSINQSAGADNAQLNGVAIAIGGARPFAIVEMDDTQLLGESPVGFSQSGPVGNEPLIDSTTGISKDAFSGAQGVVQVNQAAGNGNLTSNSFTMSVSR